MTVPLYDGFDDYDRMVRWERRLAHELPFLERQLAAVGARRVLDAACGTGRHAIALAQRGYEVTGADLSAGMVDRARANAAQAWGEISFVVAGFGELEAALGDTTAESGGAFDAVLCLGSSLPHVLTQQGLWATLADFYALLRPGGIALIQGRNFDQVLARRERWMAPQSAREGDQEWLFLRLYDYEADGTLTFHVVTLARQGDEGWTQRVEATRLHPWQRAELVAAAVDVGFGDIVVYGDMGGAPFEPATSPNLVVVARRGG
jgi:SAM-dependent methyltransferase